MKKIVVAVDFSNGSIHALKYAINVANLVKCDILMVWVDKTATPESIYSSVGENYRGEVMKRFNDLVEKFQPTFTGGTLTFKLRKGKIYNEIVTYAKTKKADLIVTGSHGVSGFEEYWIGSNANRIVAHADCPVITVRNGFQIKEKDFKIVIPIDNSNHTLIKIPFTAKLAKILDADVYIAVIFTTNLKTMHKRVENFVEKAKKYLENEEVRYKIEHFETQNTTKTTIDFAKRIDADLIAIMTEQEDSREIGLLGPNAQQIVNHSPIPVLSMHISDTDQTLKHINNSL